MNTKITYVLYGVAARDSDEFVCEFFASHDELWEFVRDLPGTYGTMRLRGVVPDDFNVFGVGDEFINTEVSDARIDCGDGSDLVPIGPGFDLPDGRHQSRRRPIAEIRTDVESSMRQVWEKQDEIVDLLAEIRDLKVRMDEMVAWSKSKGRTLAHLRSQQTRFQTELEAAIAEGVE